MEFDEMRHNNFNPIIVRKKIKDKLSNVKETRLPRWYFGGLASAGAACITHPLDTMKVYYQTTGRLLGSQTLLASTISVVKTNGVAALYNGLSASVLRQLTYSTTRFAIYEICKQRIAGNSPDGNVPLYQRMLIAGVSGAAGGFVGAPADVINVRMQNDIKLPPQLKRNYKNAIHGLMEINNKEGWKALFQGSSMALYRAVLMSIGQLAMYDQYKYLLVSRCGMAPDNVTTHITSSLFTSLTCTAITQPLDVLKTRMMNAHIDGRQTIMEISQGLYAKNGVLGFYKGFVPSLIRLGPHTVLVFILYEQMRIRFGHIKY